MANLCTQKIQFQAPNKENYEKLLKLLEGTEDEREDVFNWSGSDLKLGYVAKHVSEINAVDENDDGYCVNILVTTRWSPEYKAFEHNQDLINLGVTISGYAEEPGCGIYEVYNIGDDGYLDVESYYSDPEDLIRFYNDIYEDDYCYILDQFCQITECAENFPITDEILELLDYDSLVREKNNLNDEKINKYSLLTLAICYNYYDFTLEEINKIFEESSIENIYYVLSFDNFRLIDKFFIQMENNEEFPRVIFKVLPLLLKHYEITGVNLNGILSTYDKEFALEQSISLYEGLTEEVQEYYLEIIDEKFCDKLMLFEKKMNK